MKDGEHYWGCLRQRWVSRRRFLAGSGVAAAGSMAMLAGCGGDPAVPRTVAMEAATATEAPPPAATEASETIAGSSATPNPTAAPTPDPYAYRRGGTLRLWKHQEDAGLDPGIFHLNNRDIIYSTLTQPLTKGPAQRRRAGALALAERTCYWQSGKG